MKSKDTTHRALRSKLLALALTASLLLVGCLSSTPPDPIRIGSAPAEPTRKINLDLPVDSSGFFMFTKWPNACDLVTDRDVRAVFPQARGIGRKPKDKKLTIFANLLSTFGPTGPPGPRDVTVKNASCKMAFSLPGVERKDEYPDSTGYQLTIDIDAAGTEEVVRENDTLDKDDPRARLGGATCSLSFGSFSCIKGKLAFGLYSSQIDQGEVDGKRRLRYQVGTEVTSFEPGTGLKNYKTQTKFEDVHIRSELVKAVASKI